MNVFAKHFGKMSVWDWVKLVWVQRRLGMKRKPWYMFPLICVAMVFAFFFGVIPLWIYDFFHNKAKKGVRDELITSNNLPITTGCKHQWGEHDGDTYCVLCGKDSH